MSARNGNVEDGLPVDSIRDAIQHLRRPFTPAAVKFKVQSTSGNRGLIVAYIDQRLASERLNLVCPHLWFDAYEPTASGLMWCHLTVGGITRSDVGEGKGKGLVSDALKRAAVKFGVGVSLYAVPHLWLSTDDGCLKSGNDGKLRLESKGEKVARLAYEHWLDQHGRTAFGEPLDHGDIEGAQGDAETETPAVADERPRPVSDIPSDFPGPQDAPLAPVTEPEEVSGDVVPEPSTIDPAFASDLFDVCAAKLTTVGQFRGMLEGVGASLPQDLRTKEARLAVLSALSLKQGMELERALRVLPGPRAAA